MKIFAIPRPGVRVRHPDTGRALLPQGEEVERGGYWLRRAKDGDITIQPITTWHSAPDDAAVAVEGVPFSDEEKEKEKGKKRKGVSNG